MRDRNVSLALCELAYLFCGMHPNQSLSEFMKILKQETSKWITAKGHCTEKFKWQEGFGAFSYARSQVKTVGDYVDNQEKHHATQPEADAINGLGRARGEEFVQTYGGKYSSEWFFSKVLEVAAPRLKTSACLIEMGDWMKSG